MRRVGAMPREARSQCRKAAQTRALLREDRGEPAPDAVKRDLIDQQSGKFEPQKMPNEYARAVHELVQAKIEQRAPEVEIETAKGETPKVINIMDALKKSMQAKGQTKVREAVRKKMGKAAPKRPTAPPSPRSAKPSSRRTAH